MSVKINGNEKMEDFLQETQVWILGMAKICGYSVEQAIENYKMMVSSENMVNYR